MRCGLFGDVLPVRAGAEGSEGRGNMTLVGVSHLCVLLVRAGAEGKSHARCSMPAGSARAHGGRGGSAPPRSEPADGCGVGAGEPGGWAGVVGGADGDAGLVLAGLDGFTLEWLATQFLGGGFIGEVRKPILHSDTTEGAGGTDKPQNFGVDLRAGVLAPALFGRVSHERDHLGHWFSPFRILSAQTVLLKIIERHNLPVKPD